MTAEVQAFKDSPHPTVKLASKLLGAGQEAECCAILEKHLREFPDDAQALTVYSSALKAAGRVAASYYAAKWAVEKRPDRAETWNSLGIAAQHLWRIDEAMSCYRKALQRAKSNRQKGLFQNNIASCLIDLGKFAKAEDGARAAIALNPDDKLAHHNLGLSLLSQRQWKEAWPEYSHSLGTQARIVQKYREPHEPTWDGTKGKTVVVYGEQGLGDEICAASMLPDVIRDSKRVIVDCDHRLEGLFKRSFPGASIYGTRWAKKDDGKRWEEDPATFDYSVSAFEVGQFYRNSDADFPGTAYLVPDPDRVAMWKALFATKKKPVIGIAWTGGTWQNAAQYRQLPLAEWAPIFAAVDAHWVSLQYKDAAKDIAGTPVVQYPYGTLTKDYDDTAALVASCDLVIGMQTSVFHLAGALGKEAWVMIPSTSQWRYGESGDSIPWYQSMKLYRQGTDWTSTVKQIAKELHARFK